jgi:hypothetical protein
VSDGWCANCGIRQATLNWVGEGGVLAYAHGLASRWCERCVVAAQLEHARKLAASIPDLAVRLAALDREAP